jgi:hypothetical protein
MWACAFCHKGVFQQHRPERISFRQWSDKGYVRCQVTVMVFVCDACGTRSVDPEAGKIMDDAFRQEYAKLR